jgi:hypothetical protein
METIKASELRTKNYVQTDYEGILEVININSEGFDYIDARKPTFQALGRFPLDCVKPIPLTEEWLLKFGFEKNSYWFKDDNMLRFGLIDNKLHCSIGNDENGFLYNRINYVHQLQNLYFALTGQELEFKQ